MSTNITFYADLRSQPCRAIYLFLKLNKIPFQMKKVDILKGEHREEKFTAICDLGTLPVMADNGFAIGESCAILRYLAKKFSVPDHWYPTNDSQKQARLEEYLHWHHSNTRRNALWTFRHQFIPVMRGEPVNQEEVDTYKAALAKTLNRIENYFLKGYSFIAGAEISIADLLALCEFMQLDMIGDENLYMSIPKIKEWVDKVKAVLGSHLEDCFSEAFSDIKARYDKTK